MLYPVAPGTFFHDTNALRPSTSRFTINPVGVTGDFPLPCPNTRISLIARFGDATYTCSYLMYRARIGLSSSMYALGRSRFSFVRSANFVHCFPSLEEYNLNCV